MLGKNLMYPDGKAPGDPILLKKKSQNFNKFNISKIKKFYSFSQNIKPLKTIHHIEKDKTPKEKKKRNSKYPESQKICFVNLSHDGHEHTEMGPSDPSNLLEFVN